MAECSVNDHRVVNEKQAQTVNTKALYPKAQLQKRDSGYNSPVTPGTTPENTNPSKAKSLHLGAQPLRSVSSPSALDCSEGVMQKFVQSPQLPLPQNQLASGKKIMKRQLSSPGALDSSQTKQFLHLGVQSSQLNHQQSQRMMLGQQEELQRQAPFSCDGSSVLFLAYKCKELAPLAWSGCKHPYCVMVRNNLAHMRTCYASSGECKRCQQFDSQMYRHAEECTLAGCPVDMCCNIKQQLQQEFGSLPYDHNNPFVPHPLQRGNSFSGSSSGQYYRNTNQSSLLFSFSQFESASISDDSPAARYIGARADEIVEKLDREEPLLLPEAPSTAPLTSLGRPASLLRANTVPSEDYQLNVLSPIAESPPFGVPHLLGGDYSMQSLSLMSSYEQDGIFKQGSKPAGGPKSLVVDEDDTTVFPEQQIMHKFRDDYLSIGGDGHYYQFRDYNANDNLITGGFGAVRFAEDLSSNHLFAIKCNNKDDNAIIESMETEARLLSQLGPHINVIQMYGAVLDCQEQDFLPTRMYKLMMELSQHGNLAEMVMGPETKEPFPLERDQALFYFWQVLKGVDFLHKSNVLHLDIKGSNILVFDEGRTLKICDFGTAVYVDEVASKVGKNLGTLQFSAPEICRQQMPHFSSDMWSTMCVLVEILTGKKPWEHYSSCMNGLIFTIGHYRDEQMETDLIPPGAELDPDMIELMRLVFHADGTKRASARDLLVHPLIIEAYNYEACFDEVLDDECAPVEEELSYASHSSCAPASLMLSLNPQDHTHLPEGHARFPENDLKRLSKDSGTGTDLEQEMTGQYRRMSSAGRTSDSGLDTPCTADRQILSSIGKPMFTYPEENSAEVMENDGDIHEKKKSILRSHLLPPPTPSEGNCKSLPNPDLQSDPITTHVQRSFSLTLPGSHSSPSPYPFSVPIGLVQRQHQCPWSYSQLRHSYSAPVIGNDHRRRLSLQSLRSYRGEEHSNGKLRRISSEIYVDRGPDIDSPDRVRNVDVSNWAQNVQKELLLAQEHDHEQECDDMASGHTPSAEDEPLTLRILQSQNRNCSPEVQGSQGGHEVDTEGFRVQVVNGSCPQEGVARAESAPEAEASKTEVEKHVTMQGRTFDVYKTVC